MSETTKIKMPELRELKPTARGRFHNHEIPVTTKGISNQHVMRVSLDSMPKNFFTMPAGH